MSKSNKISNSFLETEALKTEGLYFSHKSGRFFEVKLAKKKILGYPTVKMKLDDGEIRTVIFFHVNLLLKKGKKGVYERIIPSEDLL